MEAGTQASHLELEQAGNNICLLHQVVAPAIDRHFPAVMSLP